MLRCDIHRVYDISVGWVINFALQDTNIWQVAVKLLVIQAITHHKCLWHSKADVKTNTLTVLVVVLVAAVVLILLDLIFGGAIHLMIGA